ncbi:MAG TPA: hypothetical protein VM759_11405 [Longimicrobium sp.]|nr:hypothetical protein [Longimicrobium sp.]
MYVHALITREHMPKPTRRLREPASSRVLVSGVAAPSFLALCSRIDATRRNGRLDTTLTWANTAVSGTGSKVDFGYLMEGGPV